MRYKYHKSDFSLLVEIESIAQNTGENVNITSRTPFVFRFWSSNCQCHPYECSSNGNGATVNCTLVDQNHVIVYFDQKCCDFKPGKLMMEVDFRVPNAHYENDNFMDLKRLYDTGIVLTDMADLDVEDATISLELLPMVIQAEGTPAEGSTPIVNVYGVNGSLPMRLATYNGNNYLTVTSASAVINPDSGKTVREDIASILSKIGGVNAVGDSKFIDVSQNGFFFVDPNLNIGFQFTKDGCKGVGILDYEIV